MATMARVFKFKEDILGTDIHTFMEMVNNRPNKEIFIAGKKVKKNILCVNDLIFIGSNGNLVYSCRAACNGPYDNGVPGQTELRLKDIVRLENPVRWNNHLELTNIKGHAWTNLKDEQVEFIFNLQPQQLAQDLEDIEDEETLEDDLEDDDDLEEGEEFLGTLLRREQIDDIKQHLIMCEVSKFKEAMSRRMRDIKCMTDREILNYVLRQNNV